MSRRLLIVLGMLGCAGVAVLTLWMVMDSKLASVPKVMAWLGLFVGGAACVLLFIIGMMRHTRDSLAARHRAAAAASRAGSFPPAADHSLARTAAQLLRVPADARDTEWESRFYASVAAAAVVPADPAQFTGFDGMPYAAFRLDETGARPAQLSLALAANAMTERGLGAALNPRGHLTADWVFTCGDLFGLCMFGRIVPAPPTVNREVTAEREVLAGSPSQALLPSSMRGVIRNFMQETLGIAKPAVFLISDAAMQPPESLVFNISGQQLADGSSSEAALRDVAWFLPRHYRAISVPADSSLARHFQPL